MIWEKAMRRKYIIVITLAGVVLACSTLLCQSIRARALKGRKQVESTAAIAQNTTELRSQHSSSPQSNEPILSNTDSLPDISKALRGLSGPQAQDAIRQIKQGLLQHSDAEAAARSVISFLDQGTDVTFSDKLKVGKGGSLTSTPTARVEMLDILGELDSEMAASYSEEVLNNSTSPDEWAIALRNYAWGTDNAASDPFLKEKVQQLLTNENWVNAPTAGYLAAFDFVPYSHDPALLRDTVALLDTTSPSSVKAAAHIAIAKFTAEDSGSAIGVISETEKERSFSALRADTYSRANFMKTADVIAIRNYLLSPDISAEEFKLFASLFPHGGEIAGFFLATTHRAKHFKELARQDARALALFRAWIQEPEFSHQQIVLTDIINRLDVLTASAQKGGYL